MLIQFNVSNFKSIREEVVLSMNAVKSTKEHSNFLLSNKKDKVLPSIAIYGANASGKSNIINAFTTAILLVRNSHRKQINEGTGIVPFLLDSSSKSKKTTMDFIFVYEGVEYAYGFVADSSTVYEEYLYEYRTAKPTTIFERRNIDKYKYTVPKFEKELKQIEDKNSSNKLFLSTATQWNCESTKKAYTWFEQCIDTFMPHEIVSVSLKLMDEYKGSKKLKEFVLNFMRHADINISDYIFESREVDRSRIILPPEIANNKVLLKQIEPSFKEYKIKTIHNVEENGKINEYNLDFSLESVGTQYLMGYAVMIYQALEKGKTVIVDEIDNSLHPILVQFIVNIFNDPDININGAQLIFTTHDVTLLDTDIFRRDQIYFVEKSNVSATTDLYSLSDFSPRSEENIRKGYMLGRYGAIPVVYGGLEWQK